MPKVPSIRRFYFLVFFVSTLFILLGYQLVQLTVIRQAPLKTVAENQHNLKVEIPPVRGEIFDSRGKEMATSLKVPSVYAVPRMIGLERKPQLAKIVSELLDIDYEFVLKRFQRDKSFVWLKRRVSFAQSEKIRKLKDPGLGILEEYKRFYPQGEMMAHILGFVNTDNQGLEGLERTFDNALKGQKGLRYTRRDALGREIKAFETKAIPAINGNRVHVTLDHYFQYLTEKALEKAFKKWNTKAATAMIMEVDTGRILAMVSRPTYDPNYYNTTEAAHRRNRVVTDMYEPGSIFKIVAASAALNENVTGLDTIFDCEDGEYHYGSRTLHDAHPYGDLTFTEVVVKSSNIGTVKIAALLSHDKYYEYIKRFGFADRTGVDLPGEAVGFVRSPEKWSKTTPYNLPMGHEILVTQIQMARAMAAIANGGNLVTPFVISKVEDQSGVIIDQKHPVIEEGIIRPEVAKQMRDILVKVVEEGTGKRARIDGIKVGGKTGTAQKVLPNGGGYSQDSFMSSFVGFAPADNPKYVMAVTLDDPGPRYYGGTVAAPVFKEVMEATLIAGGYMSSVTEIIDPSKNANELPENQPTFQPINPAGATL